MDSVFITTRKQRIIRELRDYDKSCQILLHTVRFSKISCKFTQFPRDFLDVYKRQGIFRSLTLFKEHHLVHAIEDGGDGTRYELCLSHDSARDEDAHVH